MAWRDGDGDGDYGPAARRGGQNNRRCGVQCASVGRRARAGSLQLRPALASATPGGETRRRPSGETRDETMADERTGGPARRRRARAPPNFTANPPLGTVMKIRC